MQSTCGRISAPVVLFLSMALIGCSKAPDNGPYRADRRAGLVELIPSAAMQQSPAAITLIDRLVHRHMQLLQAPALIEQVMRGGDLNNQAWVKANPGTAAERLIAALHIRAIPDTNIIEISVDAALAGDDAPKVVEAVVNQHLGNEQRSTLNKQLGRSVMLNNLKNRYQFRKDELNKQLREKAVQLSADGFGLPGRLSAKELELQNLLSQRFEVDRKITEATTPEAKKPLELQRKQLEERTDATKADLGAMTNSMNQYLAIKDDEQTARELLKGVNDQLEHIQAEGNVDLTEVQWLCHPSRN